MTRQVRMMEGKPVEGKPVEGKPVKDKTVVYSKQSGEPAVPVTVRVEWFPDGIIKPRMFWTPDGSCYEIREVCEMTPLAMLKDRGEGLRFKVRAKTKETPETYACAVADAGTCAYANTNAGDRTHAHAPANTNAADDAGDRYARLEVYLYLADNLFCGRNIIDERYGHVNKEFIRVTLDVFPDCGYEIAYFTVQGSRYKVEKLIAMEPRGSYNAGGAGVWHKVEARLVNAGDDEDPDPGKSVRRMAALFFEVNKWFVVVT